ncbi:MAG: methyltransferase domain-containing protein [Anaerolineales bacterium]|nr:methyltransferase domain-containing protein [Anaerolineales bacterium]
MREASRKEVIMPGGIELTKEAERHVNLRANTRMLSVACGTGELELYLAEKYKCYIVGVDTSDDFIRSAREKTAARRLGDLVTFEVGDGNALTFGDASFDVVFCSGALCAFFDNGLREFHRVLKPGGRAVVIDVIWRREDVPEEIERCWTGGTACVLTLNGNEQAFATHQFHTLFAREYHEPSWWEAYYEDRGNASHWQEERQNYRAHQDYIGLGLFVIEKA